METAVVSYTNESSATRIEPLFTLDEASRILRRSHWALRMDYKAGRLKCVRIGRNLMIQPDEVRRIIQEGSRSA